MTQVNLKKQQVKLLGIERKVERIAEAHAKGEPVSMAKVSGILASVSVLAVATADKMKSTLPLEQAAEMTRIAAEAETPAHAVAGIYGALISGHAAVEKLAVEAGHLLIPNASGVPKKTIENLEGVSRLLGIL